MTARKAGDLCSIAIVFALCFFGCLTLIYLGKLSVGLFLKNVTASYYSTVSVVISAVFAALQVHIVRSRMVPCDGPVADRLICEGCVSASKISDAMDKNGIPGACDSCLIQAAALEGVFGGAYLLPSSGMTRTILRLGVRSYRAKYGVASSSLFLDCHERVQASITGPSTADFVVDISGRWLCAMLHDKYKNEWADRCDEMLMGIFKEHILRVVVQTPVWIRDPQNAFGTCMS